MAHRNNDILKYPLWLLKISGIDPRIHRKKFLITAGFYTVTYIIFYAAILANFLYLEGNLILFAGNCEGFAILFQIYGKVAVVALKKRIFIKLIAECKQWSTEGCEPTIKNNLDTILVRTTYMQKLFIYGLIPATAIMLITPYFSKQFPSGIWNIPNQEELYIIILVLQEVACPLYVMVAVGIDCLFLALCVHLIVQFRILQSHLRKLSVVDTHDEAGKVMYLEKLTWSIRRHRYLLWYAKLMAQTYSPIMLMEYLSIGMVSFVEMYLIFKSDNTAHLLRGVLFSSAAFVQLCFYCIPAEFALHEALVVVDAIYESDWCSQSVPSLRNTVLLMMMRAQGGLKFSAGGLVNINLKTLLNVWQFAWSACTLMRSLQNAQEA